MGVNPESILVQDNRIILSVNNRRLRLYRYMDGPVP